MPKEHLLDDPLYELHGRPCITFLRVPNSIYFKNIAYPFDVYAYI